MSSEMQTGEVENLLDQLLLDQVKALNESAEKIQSALRQTNDATEIVNLTEAHVKVLMAMEDLREQIEQAKARSIPPTPIIDRT